MTREARIGLLWHSDRSGNLGVGALTVGNMVLARRAAERAGRTPVFHLFYPQDRATPYLADGFESRHAIDGAYCRPPGGLWRDLAGLDLVLDIAAGDSFTDIYPGRRFLFQLLTKRMVIARGIPLVHSPQTIGPFSRQPHSWAAGRILARSAAVFARDPLSADAARRLAPGAPVHQTVDVAFALPYQPAARSAHTRFGLGVSALLYSGGHTGRNEFNLEVDYRALVDGLIETLVARGDVEIVLVSHVMAPHMPHEDDPTVAEAIAARYPGVRVAPRFASPSDAKSFISGLDFFTGARMHACIAAFSSGVPVVPISYSRKFEGLFGGIGYDHVLPVRGLDTEAARAFILDRFDRRAALAQEIAAANPVASARLNDYVDVLAGLLARAGR